MLLLLLVEREDAAAAACCDGAMLTMGLAEPRAAAPPPELAAALLLDDALMVADVVTVVALVPFWLPLAAAALEAAGMFEVHFVCVFVWGGRIKSTMVAMDSWGVFLETECVCVHRRSMKNRIAEKQHL